MNKEFDLPPNEEAITAFYKDALWKYARARYDALKRSKGRCELCGAAKEDGIRLVVDHIEPIRYKWSRRLDPSNLQALCDLCNKGKGSRDRTDWRGPNRLPETKPYSPNKTQQMPDHDARSEKRHPNWQHRLFLIDPCAASVDAFLGAQGCQTSLIGSIDELIDIATKTFSLPQSKKISIVRTQILALGRKGRKVAASQNVAIFWPQPCDLYPAKAPARNRLSSHGR